MRSVLRIILPLLLTGIGLTAGQNVVIEGRILDRETRDPLPAYVAIVDGPGISADAAGRFRLSVPRPPSGKIKLSVWLIGYQKKDIEAEPGKFLAVELDLEPAPAREISVTADSIVSDEKTQKTVTLTKMEVYTLPGTAADPVTAGHVLPGVNAPPDASSLLIRGGAPDEVAYVFDGIELRHPFLSESLHESYFSVFDNQVVESFSIATTGFHPKFGDALSGVMDISAKDHPAKAEGGLGLSIFGLNSYAAFPVKGIGSFVGSYNRGFSDILTRLNSRGGGRDFRTENAFGKFQFQINRSNEIRIYGMTDSYRYAQNADPAFDVSTINTFAAVSWTSTLSRRLVFKALLASLRYDLTYDQPDAMQVRSRDGETQARLDVIGDFDRHFLEFGADFSRRRIDTSLTEDEVRNYLTTGTRLGFYAQDKFRLSDRVYFNLGGRLSSLDLLNRGWALDPRFSAAFLPTRKDVFRFSAGVYHQFGDYSVLAANPELRPKTAIHCALSYDRITEGLDLRAAVYDKEYRNLFLRDAGGTMTNSGAGYARGAEFYIKKKSAAIEALLVYNFVLSERREDDVSVLAPSPYAITHSATGIVSWKFKNGSLGLRYSIASGRPFTPLLGRDWDPAGESFIPVWGAPYSQRYPAYQRMDLNGTWNIPFLGKSVILYFGITNVLDAKNVLRFEYDADYASRKDQESIFGRSLFLGLYVPFF